MCPPFTGSSETWYILKVHVKSLLLKPLSVTKWECRVASANSNKYTLSHICDALQDLAENKRDCQLVNQNHSIENKYLRICISLVMCYEILTTRKHALRS